MNTIETEVLIIGGGVTGAGILRDLALRGIHCILIDRDDLCAGASGGNHGLLHSGARYVSNDIDSAIECQIEGKILKNIASHCIEETDGFFVSVKGDDVKFAESFPDLCSKAQIDCSEVPVEQALLMEPRLSHKTQRVFRVPDATIDPFHLALDNVADAINRGNGRYIHHCKLLSFHNDNGRITEACCQNSSTGELLTIRANQYVNAGGGWAMEIAAMAGCTEVNLLWSKGTLLITHDRLTNHVINRLRPPGNGDILVPGGTVSILGTTSVRTDDIDAIKPTVEEVNENIRQGSVMIPTLTETRFIRAFSRVRPLVQSGAKDDDRNVARGFALFDHRNTLENFCTITGGKLTTYRLMAEKTSDLLAKRLGNTHQCKTHNENLPDSGGSKWTEPGASPRYWYNAQNPDDDILCECEMVPQSAVTQIINESPGSEEKMSLKSIALRSRAGKGPCQGSFCGIRITSHLYESGYYTDREGLYFMRDFFSERFKGMRSVIWGQQMAQMELAEALHCGLLGLENLDSENDI